MAAASEVMGVMNVEGLNCEVRVRNTFIHVGERASKRRPSAPPDLALLKNLELAVAHAQDMHDVTPSSFGDDDSRAEACDSNLQDCWDDHVSDLQDEAGIASFETDDSDGQQSECNAPPNAGDAALALDVRAHSSKTSRSSVSSSVDGRSPKAASKSRGRRGSAKTKAVTKMFIGNLPSSMSTDRMVVELCEQGFFGTYTSVNLPRNADGSGRGFGFVTFWSAEEAQRFASTFRGREFEGQRCYVNPATQQSGPSSPKSEQ